ncbi:SurA N-terminal domain-containing protein [Sphingomonas sp.]|uniref:SurA N-terminal domain-containing protein n=1 Tax=Sphingomonas sp. TaxID=28214 RepID=UPI001EB1EDCA|nr:SurA N-terminal domain-containing protein [Sphingomonas sp.]MBX3593946.1 SurA N-terminal domain-containing protein [Sphingomonas sp.]
MLSFLRRLLFSTAGKFIALALLVVIAIAFALGDVMHLGQSGAPAGGALVQVGDAKVTEQELRARIKSAFERVRQEQQMLDMTQFVNSGGFDQVLEQVINSLVIEQFAQQQGMAVSKASVDGEIASIPAFQGIDGRFDQAKFDQLLAREGITADQLRADVRRETLNQWLIAPTLTGVEVPSKLALPYASLLLERRKGTVGFVPLSAIDPGKAPTDAEVKAFYDRNATRYTLPERRVIRYAIVAPSRFAAVSKATDAEIADAYKQKAAEYAPSTKRSLTQLVVADQKMAEGIAAKVKAGASLSDAAKAAGLQASTVDSADKATLARDTSQAIADAAFAAQQGALVGPLRSPLGWHIVRVEKVTQVPGKTLAQVRGTLAEEIAKRKEAEALADLRAKIDGAVGDNATFDEAVAEAKVEAKTTDPLFADGRTMDSGQAQPDPAIAQIAQGGFAMDASDDPQLIPIGQDGGFALIKTERVIAAAPRPLADIKPRVAADLIRDRQLQGARKAAAAILAEVNKGTPIADAMRKSGLRLPPLQPLDASRAQLAQMGQQLPPPVRLMFSMAEKKAKMTEAPQGAGYFIIWLDQIERGDAKGNDALIQQTRGQLGQILGNEFAEQFVAALRKSVGVKRNEAAIAQLKAQLAGRASAD